MSDGRETLVVRAGDDDADDRVDVVLGRHIPELSRRAARKMALAGSVRVGGRRVPPSHRVQPGDELTVSQNAGPRDPPPGFEALLVTDAYVYVPKPACVHTHRLRPDQPAALSDWVAALHPECAAASPDPREGGAVHRLDRDTSGVVVFARSPKAWSDARAALQDAAISKTYLTVARGPHFPPQDPADTLPGWILPGEDGTLSIRAPVGRGARRSHAAVSIRGLRAETGVRQLQANGDVRLLQLRLITGRRHQARIHLAWLGLPIWGDRLYGSTDPPPFLLHAARIDLGALGPAVNLAPPRAFREVAAAQGLDIPT